MKRVLIANRGEIAVRIIRGCREMGIQSVAICSEADLHAMHVRLADAFVCIGPPAAAQSYLSIPAILKAAQVSNADAVHPGYGFLSERAEFAEACEKAGLTFIGPSPAVIRALGDKIAARAAMETAGVPVTPGYGGESQDNTVLMQAADAIGYPVMIKAAAGGGGRGMRVVSDKAKFLELLSEARAEALAAFADDRVLLERYVARSRHVEMQILGDKHGGLVHLFERDCSLQRRHQKIVEESPCPVLGETVRARMAEAALLVAKTAGYSNAGTVEFLLEPAADGNHSFYFMEVNTRLQVEHPVTELAAGVDLVQLQLRVAAGEKLPFTQKQLSSRGHTVEVRVYAEDAAHGFLPSTGNLALWLEPSGPGIRVDAGFETGDEVSPFYDPMLAKLIVHAPDRDAALNRLEQALEQFQVCGVETNVPYLQAIAANPVFRSGLADTRFLTEMGTEWQSAALPEEVLVALANYGANPPRTARSNRDTSSSRSQSAWQSASGWRNA